jgi:hypothetical protein
VGNLDGLGTPYLGVSIYLGNFDGLGRPSLGRSIYLGNFGGLGTPYLGKSICIDNLGGLEDFGKEGKFSLATLMNPEYFTRTD